MSLSNILSKNTAISEVPWANFNANTLNMNNLIVNNDALVKLPNNLGNKAFTILNSDNQNMLSVFSNGSVQTFGNQLDNGSGVMNIKYLNCQNIPAFIRSTDILSIPGNTPTKQLVFQDLANGIIVAGDGGGTTNLVILVPTAAEIIAGLKAIFGDNEIIEGSTMYVQYYYNATSGFTGTVSFLPSVDDENMTLVGNLTGVNTSRTITITVTSTEDETVSIFI